MSSREEFVRELVATAGISPDEHEVQELVAKYELLRIMAASQYAVTEAFDMSGELIFDVRRTGLVPSDGHAVQTAT